MQHTIAANSTSTAPASEPNNTTKSYSRRGILRCESIYGKHYQSPGGKLVTQFFCDSLLSNGHNSDNDIGLPIHLPALNTSNFSILDIGCGLGGACHEFFKRGASKVVGVDKCADMIQIATERLHNSSFTCCMDNLQFIENEGNTCNDDIVETKYSSRIEFKCADVSTKESRALFSSNEFSVVWTRDTLLYVKDKAQIWSNMAHWLKPNGRLFLTDFVLGSSISNKSGLLDYATMNGYHLMNTSEIKKLANENGIVIDHEIDLSSLYVSIKENDIKLLNEKSEEMKEQGYTEDELLELGKQWHTSMQFVSQGHMKWICCFAHKHN